MSGSRPSFGKNIRMEFQGIHLNVDLRKSYTVDLVIYIRDKDSVYKRSTDVEDSIKGAGSLKGLPRSPRLPSPPNDRQ